MKTRELELRNQLVIEKLRREDLIMKQLLTGEGFFAMYFEFIKISNSKEDAFKKVNKLYFDLFKKVRYDSFDEFAQTKPIPKKAF